MNLHEYQAKQLFQEYQIAIPKGRLLTSINDVENVVDSLGGNSWVCKAQVHAGGRGKSGGVKLTENIADLTSYVANLLGSRLITPQTGESGLPVNSILVENVCEIDKELYLGALIDRSKQKIVFVASAVGGMNIEEVAESSPEKIFRVFVDHTAGLMPYQCRAIAFNLGLTGSQIIDITQIMLNLYHLFIDKDLSLVEINPLVITKENKFIALDAKINVDDNALYRQKSLAQWYDVSQENELEYKAREMSLNYISLAGNIGCMVNGAGLAMATMDLIKLHGGEPANFLDVGGGITADRVVAAFKLVLSDEKVKAVLVNIFGGIVRCDLIAAGIIQAIKEVELAVPVIIRLEGTNAEEGRKLIDESGLAVEAAEDLSDAAIKAVKAAGR